MQQRTCEPYSENLTSSGSASGPKYQYRIETVVGNVELILMDVSSTPTLKHGLSE